MEASIAKYLVGELSVAERARRDPDPRRLRLPARLPRRARAARREARLDRRRDVGDPEADHQPPAARRRLTLRWPSCRTLLRPLEFLIGTWRGEGVGAVPGGGRSGLPVRRGADASATTARRGSPTRAGPSDPRTAAGCTPRPAGGGRSRPTTTARIGVELVLAHPTGVVEVLDRRRRRRPGRASISSWRAMSSRAPPPRLRSPPTSGCTPCAAAS